MKNFCKLNKDLERKANRLINESIKGLEAISGKDRSEGLEVKRFSDLVWMVRVGDTVSGLSSIVSVDNAFNYYTKKLFGSVNPDTPVIDICFKVKNIHKYLQKTFNTKIDIETISFMKVNTKYKVVVTTKNFKIRFYYGYGESTKFGIEDQIEFIRTK